MVSSIARPTLHALIRPVVSSGAIAVLALVGWAGLALVAVALARTTPPSLGFDLRLVLEAGQRVAAGRPVYDPGVMAAAASLKATDLFYSYPPIVAQAASIVAGIPVGVATVALGLLATAGAIAGSRAVDRAGPNPIGHRVVPILGAALPFVFPFSVAILFGNVDALYPVGYGLVLLAALRPGPRTSVAGGVALGLLVVAKVHPALMGAWFLVRGVAERSRATRWSWTTLSVAVATAGLLVVLSLAAFGPGPWVQYADVARAIASVRVEVAANVAPAAQLGLLFGLTETTVRQLHVVVAVAAVAVTLVAAWRVQHPAASLVVAAIASLVVLPVTWLHYPAALIPFGVAAVGRSPRAVPLVLAAVAAAALSIAAPVSVWIAVALVGLAAWPVAPARAGRTTVEVAS